MRRLCSCEVAGSVCPVHQLQLWFRSLELGATPFAHLTPQAGIQRLRRRLGVAAATSPEEFTL
eukprot:5324211-Alexandrium_andersonii.AAC.1